MYSNYSKITIFIFAIFLKVYFINFKLANNLDHRTILCFSW